MNNERVKPKIAAKELQMDVITLRELMKREKLPIGYAVKREGKSKWGFYIYRHLLDQEKERLGIANRFVSRKGCHLVEPETYKLGDDGSEIYEINEQPYYVDDETGKQFRCAYPHGFVPTIHRYRMGEYRDKKRQRNIFVGSMSDVFGEWVPDRWIREVFNACEKAPQHNYLFLTKNPKRYMELHHYGELPLRDNMWYGTTVTDPDTEYMGQDGHYEFHTFLSVEPILADFGELSEKSYIPEWIIVGAETGSRKDKVIPRREWIENIVEQCRKYNIPVFMKPSLTDIWGEELIQEFPKALIHA